METILIVEDSPTQRELLRYSLTQEGYDIVSAANGREALAEVFKKRPDLILTDIVMPEIDGYELCRRIKTNPQFQSIPVVLLTSLSNSEDLMGALECGANSFIGKPFDVSYLISQIRTVIANQKLPWREHGGGVEKLVGDREFRITAERRQILDMLLSAYDAAVRRNNEMIVAQKSLKTLNEELEDRVRDRTAKLEESNRSLEAFCYSIAHDLRAPLRAIQGFVSALVADYGPALDDTARDYASRTCQAAARMDKLIADLLAFGRISQTDITIQQIEWEPFIKGILAEFRFEIEKKNASVEETSTLPTFRANPLLLEQILANLIGNALKFTQPGQPARVSVKLEERGDRILLSVSDNGVGIDPAYHHKLFKLFERLHTNPAYEGTGIGLAIVQKAVERMRGEIHVESNIGAGTTFQIQFPK